MAKQVRRVAPGFDDIAAAIGTLKKAFGTVTDPTHHHTAGASVAIVETRVLHVEAPETAALTGYVNTADIANGAASIAAQPKHPCKLQVRIVDANSSISAGSVVLVGIGARGQAVTQTILATGGTKTVITDDAYAHITSVTPGGLVGNASGDTLGVGPSTALGLPGPKVLTPSSFAVFKANVDNADETVGTVDATAGTIAPTTAANGTHTYDFWYNFTYTPATAANTADASTGITVAVGGTSNIHLDASEAIVLSPDATDLASSLLLCNEIWAILNGPLGAYPGHLNDLLAHKAADTVNTHADPKAVDLTTAYVMANHLYTDYNAHLTQSGVHQNNDVSNAASSSSATTQNTLNLRLNDIKAKLNTHMADAVPGTSLRISPA